MKFVEPASALDGTPSPAQDEHLVVLLPRELAVLAAAPAPASRPVAMLSLEFGSPWPSRSSTTARRRGPSCSACARSQAREAHSASHPPSAMRRPAPGQAPHSSFRGSRSQARRIPLAGRHIMIEVGRRRAAGGRQQRDAGRGADGVRIGSRGRVAAGEADIEHAARRSRARSTAASTACPATSEPSPRIYIGVAR